VIGAVVGVDRQVGNLDGVSGLHRRRDLERVLDDVAGGEHRCCSNLILGNAELVERLPQRGIERGRLLAERACRGLAGGQVREGGRGFELVASRVAERALDDEGVLAAGFQDEAGARGDGEHVLGRVDVGFGGGRDGGEEAAALVGLGVDVDEEEGRGLVGGDDGLLVLRGNGPAELEVTDRDDGEAGAILRDLAQALDEREGVLVGEGRIIGVAAGREAQVGRHGDVEEPLGQVRFEIEDSGGPGRHCLGGLVGTAAEREHAPGQQRGGGKSSGRSHYGHRIRGGLSGKQEPRANVRDAALGISV